MSPRPLLEVDSIAVTYGHVFAALRDVTLTVPEGAIVAVLGGNGAGKSTTLKAISNLVAAERGMLTAGTIAWRGEAITQAEPWTLAERGLVQVLEGRRCFAHLSVDENLRIGAFVTRPSRGELAARIERVYDLFPRLKARRSVQAGYTSGGEQQMVAIARALMARPALILLDEPSMGLAPQVVDEIFETLARLNREENVSFLLAEQNAALVLRYAQYGYVLEGGRVFIEGPAAELAGVDALRDAYLGTREAGSATRRSGRYAVGDGAHYVRYQRGV